MMNYEYYQKYEPLFGSWKIESLLGEGSFGKVYEIVREDFGTTYKAAVKAITIPKDQNELNSILADGMDAASAQEYLQQFVEEIVGEFELMAKLKGNSNIVSYEDHMAIKHSNGIGWDILIRMELLTPLLTYIKTTALTKRDVIKLGIDMCHALELCQKYNIIHRDIKPENIFISDAGDFKLGDFGIARTVEKTTAGLSKKGTYTYMAPEVYKGQSYGTSVDMYSLGIVLYRLLNHNRAPFMPQYPEQITYSDREKSLVLRMGGNPLPRPAGVSEGRLIEIVLKACTFLPEDRYSSPTQMREDLEAILYTEGEGALMYPSGDAVEIKSVEYITGSKNRGINVTEPMVFPGANVNHDNTEVMESAGESPSKERKHKKIYKGIAGTVAAVAVLCSLGVYYWQSMEPKAIPASGHSVAREAISTPVDICFESESSIETHVFEKLMSRFEAMGISFAAEQEGSKVLLTISETDIVNDLDGFAEQFRMMASVGDITLEDGDGNVILRNDDFVKAEEKHGKVGNAKSEQYYISIELSEGGKSKLLQSGFENVALKINAQQIKVINIKENLDGNDFIIHQSREKFLLAGPISSPAWYGNIVYADGDKSENLIRYVVVIVNSGELPYEFKVTIDEKLGISVSEKEEPVPAENVEWILEGYEDAEPYKEYERKHINGEATDETRYTGNQKPVSENQPNTSASSSKNNVKQPTQPAKQQAKPAQQTQPTQPEKPAQPAQQEKPAQPAQPAQPEKPAQPAQNNTGMPEVYVDFD